MKIQSANQLIGAATGVIVCAGFGALWMVCALSVRQTLSLRTAAWIAPVLIVLVLGALPLLLKAKHWPRVPADPAIRRAFLLANAAQWSGLFAVFFLFSRLHLDNYIFSASAAVVGLHFFPLARAFRSVTHYATGVALVAWAAISVVSLPIEHLPSNTGFGTGLILWVSAAVILARTTKAVRQSTEFQAA